MISKAANISEYLEELPSDRRAALTELRALIHRIAPETVETTAGSLDETWRRESGTPVYCTNLDAEGARQALPRVDRSRSHEPRELALQKFQQLPQKYIPGHYPSPALAGFRHEPVTP